jgi:SulP family sulfate permease
MLPNRFHPFRPRLLDALQGYNRQRFFTDLGAGITVGIVALPLALAFGIASGVKPEQGLITAVIAGFLISALGGSQVQIGGPAGAFIVIVYGIIDRYGFTNLLVSTVMAGMLMFVLGLFKLGGADPLHPGERRDRVHQWHCGADRAVATARPDGPGHRQDARRLLFATGRAGRCHRQLQPSCVRHRAGLRGGLALWPRLFTPGRLIPAGLLQRQPLRTVARLPAPIVALVVLTLAAYLLEFPVETIGSRFGELPRGLPSLDLPPLSWDSLRQLFIPTITIALLGAIESLLCARVADNMTSFKRHDSNQELMAQGVANIVTPLFGGIPATGTIARTVTNVRAGAVSPVAGIVHAITLFLILLIAAPLASHVPLAALAGILLFVAWNMFEGHQFTRLRQFSVPYRTLMLGTFVLTIVFDLTVAVEVGLVLACVFFIWRMGTLFSVKPHTENDLPPGVAAFELYGALFFGAVGKIEALPEQLPAGTRAVVLDMQRLISMDTSGLDAMEQMQRTLRRQGIALVLANVNEQPLSLIRRSGFEAVIGAENIVPNIAAAMQDDQDDPILP